MKRKTGTGLTLVPPSDAPPIEHRAFDDFVKMIDNLVRWSDEIEDATTTLRRPISSTDDREAAIFIADSCDDDEETEWQIAKCRAFAEMFDPPGNYDQDKRLKREIVARRLAKLIGSFPTGPRNLEDFSTVLLSEVEGEQPNLIALESACRWIVRNMKFVPTVSEVVEIIGEHKERWQHRWKALDSLQKRQREMLELAAAVTAKRPTL